MRRYRNHAKSSGRFAGTYSRLSIIVGRRRAGALILHLFSRTKLTIELTSMVKNRESEKYLNSRGITAESAVLCHDRKPVFRTIECGVVICVEQLLMGRVQSKDFDSWVFHPNPSD